MITSVRGSSSSDLRNGPDGLLLRVFVLAGELPSLHPGRSRRPAQDPDRLELPHRPARYPGAAGKVRDQLGETRLSALLAGLSVSILWPARVDSRLDKLFIAVCRRLQAR